MTKDADRIGDRLYRDRPIALRSPLTSTASGVSMRIFSVGLMLQFYTENNKVRQI